MTEIREQDIELREHRRRLFEAAQLTAEEGEFLWRRYGKQVAVEFPSPRTAGRWALTAAGFVGQIPFGRDRTLYLAPKVPLENLFQMLELAYRLRSFLPLQELVAVSTLEDFYERLASVFARRVLDRARRGLHRDYLGRTDRLPYVRGSLELRRALGRPWRVALPCAFEEHTADIDDNRLLAWTLTLLARSGRLSERIRPRVRTAYRAVSSLASPTPFSADDCVGRTYHRLNDDYRALHALCHFFLENTGPTYRRGERRVLPFLISMHRLFELFVAEWLRGHLPPEYALRTQKTVQVGDPRPLSFMIDMVLCRRGDGRPLAVLDTKYKRGERPSTEDVYQIVTYAQVMNCRRAFLVLPERSAAPFEAQVGEIRVQRLAFDLGGDLEAAGERLRDAILAATIESEV